MNKFIYLRFSSYNNKNAFINYAYHFLNTYNDHNLILDYGSKFDLQKNGIKYLINTSKKRKIEVVTPNINMIGYNPQHILKKNNCKLYYNDILNKKNNFLFKLSKTT